MPISKYYKTQTSASDNTLSYLPGTGNSAELRESKHQFGQTLWKANCSHFSFVLGPNDISTIYSNIVIPK